MPITKFWALGSKMHGADSPNIGLLKESFAVWCPQTVTQSQNPTQLHSEKKRRPDGDEPSPDIPKKILKKEQAA
jgi:hypothetical protein